MFEGSDFKTRIQFQPSYPKEEEPSILESEVRHVLKRIKKNVAAGADGITTEAIRASRETGIAWLTA